MSETNVLLHIVMNINHSCQKSLIFNNLKYCLNFDQMPQNPALPKIRVCSAQLLHRVIRCFRGYPKLMCNLNQLTRR